MKKLKFLLVRIVFIISFPEAKAQPVIQWDKTYGADGGEGISSVVEAHGKGSIFAGGNPFQVFFHADAWLKNEKSFTFLNSFSSRFSYREENSLAPVPPFYKHPDCSWVQSGEDRNLQ